MTAKQTRPAGNRTGQEAFRGADTILPDATPDGTDTRTVERWLAEGIITSDQKPSTPTGDHLFRADREDVQRGGVA